MGEVVELSGEEVLRRYASKFHDARLTPRGLEEAMALRGTLSKLSPPPEVVITSPLSRTTATAVAAFGDSGIPILASELWRERCGRFPCERRRTRRALRADFPSVDFSNLATEEDALWTEERETFAAALQRAALAVNELLSRSERAIAVVSHGGFLAKSVFHKRSEAFVSVPPQMGTVFSNCELRCAEVVPENGVASLRLRHIVPSEAYRDPVERARARELQHSNMGRLMKLFSTPRAEELLREMRPSLRELFKSDSGLAHVDARL